jgi:peptide-methionine (S)-S-oxide reductase
VLVVFDPQIVDLAQLLKVFWEAHDPTQGYRQGNDIGTQYRSVIYADDAAQLDVVRESAKSYGQALKVAGNEAITTEIKLAPTFYYAEDYHQQYLHKVPNGYCGLKGTGVACLID